MTFDWLMPADCEYLWSYGTRVAETPNIISPALSDGFALNVGLEDWQVDRVRDCYSAAQSVDLPFKLFISFDMTWVQLAGFPSQNRANPDSNSRAYEWLGVPRAHPQTISDACCATYSPS